MWVHLFRLKKNNLGSSLVMRLSVFSSLLIVIAIVIAAYFFNVMREPNKAKCGKM
jgi:Tfp pilus assembly protein PilO